jgi:two-component system, OmpR family, alkaline phosphatase synthesis response regulator PhoP
VEKQKKVLIIEDDPNIADLVEIHLNDLGFELERAEDGRTGLEMALSNNYSIVILDLMLPQLSGLEVCKEIRSVNKYLPILMLTAKSEELDKVLGLELGADDYLTKPFSIHELIARIKAILRRLDVNQENKIDTISKKDLIFDRLFIDLEKRKVTLSGNQVDLTVKEFDLLALFAQKPGRAFNRQELLDLVWGYQFVGYEHTVNSHINRLRNKIETDPANPFFIRTVWGVGYRFVEPEEEDQ